MLLLIVILLYFRTTISVKGQKLRHLSLVKCKSQSNVSELPLTQLLRLHTIQEYNLSDFLISLAYNCGNLQSLTIGKGVFLNEARGHSDY